LVNLVPVRARRAEGDVDAARRGDRAAFGRLFEKHAPMVHGILLAYVEAPDADDLMQDVFLAAMERIDSLREDGHFGGWLASISRHRVLDFLRSRKPVAEVPPGLAVVDPRRAEANEALRAIRSLPEAYREPLILRLVEGMTGPEIAERCGLTPESVRVNLHRGMAKLREALGVEEVRDGE
jgi:RNA polymerase sigma-70 factor, ECF subfamily